MNDPVLITVAVAKRKEARRIAEAVLDAGIVACAHMIPVSSVYLWKGKKVKGKECLLLLKTVRKRFKQVEKMIQELSSYECPSIEMIRIEAMSTQALQWLLRVVK